MSTGYVAAKALFPSGNILVSSRPGVGKYSRTVIFLLTLSLKIYKIFPYVNFAERDEGHEIHTTGHRQAGPRDPQGAWRDAKGARPDFRHGTAIHHRTRKGQRDRRNRQGLDDPADARHSINPDATASGDKARIVQWHACSMSICRNTWSAISSRTTVARCPLNISKAGLHNRERRPCRNPCRCAWSVFRRRNAVDFSVAFCRKRANAKSSPAIWVSARATTTPCLNRSVANVREQ